MIKQCIVCNKEIEVKSKSGFTQKFCSHQCYYENLKGKESKKKNGKTIQCKTCKKEIYVSQYGLNRVKYCSRKCQVDDNYGFKARNKNCVECNTLFLIKNQLELQNKYCSDECRKTGLDKKQILYNEKLRNKIQNISCKFCKKEFTCNGFFKRIYCSKECQVKQYSQTRIGKNNPAYKNGLYTFANFQNRSNPEAYKHLNECARYRKEFIAKYGYQFCEVCGVNKNGTMRFEVHHIYYASLYPKHKHLHDNRNLIHICIECHHKFHSGKMRSDIFLKLEEERGLKELFKVEFLQKST